MERQQYERRTKHHEAAGASGSSRAATSHSKKLAKRPRPSSLHEASSPEDSPPRATTPSTPNEYEALRMRAPEVHTNLEVVNYNKVDPKNIVSLREISCYNKSTETGTDEQFWTFFQQDWYGTMFFMKNKHVVPVQWIHFDYMRKKKDTIFNRILEACDFHGITNLMQFRYNWNKEVILEFYATLFFDKKERIFMWMTDGRRFSIKLSQFAEILGLSSHLNNPKKLHMREIFLTPS
jgi:hypothetical protein